MFISDVQKQDECRLEALHDLRTLGIKSRPRKFKPQQERKLSKVFNVPLGLLPSQTVTLRTGQQVVVPKLVHELCSYILPNINSEGIFRREGLKSRQAEIKNILNSGRRLNSEDFQVYDIAAVLKVFLRELPEPLVPHSHHEMFLQCVQIPNKTHALLLACLLLPLDHLNTLTYILHFFHEVAEHSKENKMDSYNLAVVSGPNIIPISEKIEPDVQARTTRTVEIMKILIENAENVGLLPDDVINRLSKNTNSGSIKKKKKRRSGSLTRMFSGLKKIVGGKNEESQMVVPDLLLTPINATKKRRIQRTSEVCNKKKKDLPNTLSNNVTLNRPYSPCRTPISMDLSVKDSNAIEIRTKERKWFSRSRSVKNLKHEESQKSTIKPALERRWSAISQPNLKKNKKRNSFTTFSLTKNKAITTETNTEEPDYIRVSKTEFESIKSRVCAMERRISIELDSVQSQIASDNENNENVEVDNNLEKVQTVYQQTLVQSEQLSPTTDQLAKRLSRELKIRRSAEQKIIRSPSARKIGSIRRRSRELSRHQSWHVPERASLRRRNPNLEVREGEITASDGGSSSEPWVSAEGFFATLKSCNSSSSFNDRASLARLRNQNAGMVMAKAKLFDQLKNSESCLMIPKAKIGAPRLPQRVRNLKYEERKKAGKKSLSPKRRNGALTQRQKLQIAKQIVTEKENFTEGVNYDKNTSTPLKDSNRIEGVLTTPQIKKTLNVRTPKRLCRTPRTTERVTPLRGLRTPSHHHI